MKRNLLLLKLVIFTFVMVVSTKTEAQIFRNQTPIPGKGPVIVLQFFTYDKMNRPTNVRIEYCTFYDKATGNFINAPECNWSNTTTSKETAYIDGETGTAMKFRFNGGVFEITPDEWGTIQKRNSIKFRGWDEGSYKIVPSDF